MTEEEQILQDQKEMSDAVDEQSETFKELYSDTISTLSLIVISSLTLREKIGKINEAIERLQVKQIPLIERHAKKTFLEHAKRTQVELGLKPTGMSTDQEKALKLLIDDLKLEMKTVSDVLRSKTIYAARRGAQQKALQEIKPTKAIKETPLTTSIKKKPIVFNDSLGRKIDPVNQVNRIIGDSLWDIGMQATATVMIANNLLYVRHISILDDRTTPLCRSLHNKKRNVLKDQLPPMHGGCRSRVVPYLSSKK